jgi:hypothetical protein
MKTTIIEICLIAVTSVMVFLAGFLFLQWTEERDAKIMSIHYCYQELADGSLYHYVCEE